MAKQPWKVELTIEADEAFGLVLRKLHEMPGVTDIRPILDGIGGTGAGAKRLEEAVSKAHAKANGPRTSEAILKFLMQQNAPVRLTDIVKAIDRPQSSISSTLHVLKKSGVIKSAGVGLYEIAVRPHEGEAATPLLALPAPAHGPGGRMVPGAGPAVMLVILQHHAAPVPVGTLREQMMSRGIVFKSINGILTRALRDKLVKRSGGGNKTIYELTAKGQQMAQATVAHGN